jgi:hypothetical protein
MKKTTFLLALCVLCNVIVAQDLIKPVRGESFFTEVKSVESGKVTYRKGPQIETMPISEVALIEYAETGVEYFHKEALQTVDSKSIGSPIYKKGNCVYVPFSSALASQRNGALKLRELVTESGLWEVVDCAEEAHFILQFVYSEEGRDYGVIYLKDRMGNLKYQTSEVRTHKPEEVAQTLFDGIRYDLFGRESGKMKVSKRGKSFILRPEIGYGFSPSSIRPTVTLGYQFNPFFVLGAGAGMDYNLKSTYGTATYYYAYANLRAYFCDKPVSPYFDIKIGCGHSNYNYYGYDYGYNSFTYRASFGVQYNLVDFGISYGNGLSVNVGYNIQFKKKQYGKFK